MAARKRASSGPKLATYKGMRISQRVLDDGRHGRPAPQPNPFQIDLSKLHPAGVVPPEAKLAMDSIYSEFGTTAGWSYGGLSAAIAEGQIFLGYPTLAALMQRVEYLNAVATIADDMTRKCGRSPSPLA
jgi:hypothetical protein